jgi:cell division protein FtsQ
VATRALNPRRPGAGRALPRVPLSLPDLGDAVTRRRVIAALVAIAVLYGAYLLWFRNLPLFSIDEVTVSGATTNQAAIQKAVEQVAGDMTTLHLKDDELREVVAHFPTVASVGATTSFPHTLHVTVTERLPVGFIKVGDRRTAVSADGYLLIGAAFNPKDLPRLQGASAQGVRLTGDGAAEASILGATPAPLRNHVASAGWDEDQGGVVVGLDGGPDLRFGDGSRAADKWTAAVAVLSSSEHGSPSYLDVSVPDRPVSGG